ncbi:MAG TPA: PhzF family phenazine biosynthesis protein [Acidimicrobiales bacterium]|nr:PhzF family phenazine biosynthesis protein [Acidimicrobiales bacterium]
MPLELAVVDAFTDRPFTGNPAAVAVVPAFPADDRMQLVAREMSLSETAFAVPRADGEHDLRWFTPYAEVDLCGHATLATAHVLGGSGTFHTRRGVLRCTPGEGGWIDMDFPADPPAVVAAPGGGLGLPARRWGRGRDDVLVELADAEAVRSMVPDLGAVAALGSRALIVTAASDRAGVDCVSRVFGPNVGIPEDPVTGSAHCTLACYWSERLGRSSLVGEQASARGGIVRMRLAGDRVVLSGQAVTVATTTLHA